MLTERGIEANPEKFQTVINMRSPQSVKEVQQLAERITALSRFISRLMKTTILIFNTLKKGGNFAWTSESEEAFLRLKAMLAAPPVLTRPTLVLRKPDLAERMVAWSIHLSDFDISFGKRGHIKAQALADFITELTLGGQLASEGREWFLSVDGASNQARSGAGVILEGLDGVLIKQSLHFEFKASNNQAEYEALLAEMKLAQELEAKILTAKSDSKLVTSQVNGEYQARDPQLIKYWVRVTKMAATFEKFTLLHVPREQKQKG
ncbi:rnhA, partial [Mucuna pruriens]